MKFIFFTPANKKSAIGRMAALVTRELVARGCQMTVVRTEAKELLTTGVHDFGARVVSWDDEEEILGLIQSADAGIYHIGNSFDFHAGGIRWLVEFPGLVCLHDFFLGHLFYGWAQLHRMEAEAVLQRWYGEEMAQQFFTFSSSELFIDNTHKVMPMTEWICSQADGVITHSQWGCDRVLNSCPGPVRVVPLAYDVLSMSRNSSSNMPTSASQKLKILTIGHVNANKRIASLIEAIGRSDMLKQNVIYRSVGAVQPEMRSFLEDLAERLGVSLVISGEVDDNELAQAIVESDIISCLRWPALEAASASAIEAMLHGKAVIVTDTGFYAEIPSRCVIKIMPDNEIVELQVVLERFYEDKNRVRELGKEARRWSSQTFTAQNYATQLVDIVEQISRAVPVKKAVENFCDILQTWSANGTLISATNLVHSLSIFDINR